MSTVTNAEESTVALNFMDVGMITSTSIDTITFYAGEPPAAYLQDRVAAILNANLWLAGRLRAGCTGVNLAIPACFEPGRHFQETTIKDLQDMDVGQQRILLSEYLVKPGIHDNPLFTVTLVHTLPARFAVVVSMNHGIADGYTYYQIYGMLSAESVVKSMDANREVSFSRDAMSSVFGDAKVKGMSSPSSHVGLVVSLMRLNIWKLLGYETEQYRLVDSEWVAQQKKLCTSAMATDAGMQYVSTNDILTSWFLHTGAYKAGLTAVNLRERMPSVGQSLAGNYHFALHYFPEQFASPVGIRTALTMGLRSSRPEFNTVTERLCGNLALVTDWASLHQDVELPNCEQLLHLPIVKLDSTISLMFIFRATKSRFGVVLRGCPNKLDRLLKSGATTPIA